MRDTGAAEVIDALRRVQALIRSHLAGDRAAAPARAPILLVMDCGRQAATAQLAQQPSAAGELDAPRSPEAKAAPAADDAEAEASARRAAYWQTFFQQADESSFAGLLARLASPERAAAPAFGHLAA